MPLSASSFAEPMRALLADLELRPFPLVQTASTEGVPAVLEQRSAADLFPSARYPQEALSGLLLRLGLWDRSHQLSQDLDTVEGSYWHGIAHRLEPDYGNAGYWFRRVGRHPVFPELYARAGSVLAESQTSWRLTSSWDPFLYIRWCEEATQSSDPEKRNAALAIQRAEWELLFEWCGTGD
jgi:hypothetical protein